MTAKQVLGKTKFREGAKSFEMTVEGGLTYLSGNPAPYFSLTCATHLSGRPNACYSGGADHRAILKRFPQFADLAVLHLSDIDGVPSFAIENGFFWLAGAVEGNFGQQYHGGNSDRQHWKADGEFDGYRHSTPDECLATLASHLRISLEEAKTLRETIKSKADLAAYVETQKPRYKAEAEAVIARHDLKVTGDAWKAAA